MAPIALRALWMFAAIVALVALYAIAPLCTPLYSIVKLPEGALCATFRPTLRSATLRPIRPPVKLKI